MVLVKVMSLCYEVKFLTWGDPSLTANVGSVVRFRCSMFLIRDCVLY